MSVTWYEQFFSVEVGSLFITFISTILNYIVLSNIRRENSTEEKEDFVTGHPHLVGVQESRRH